MPERPLILFPVYEESEKAPRPRGGSLLKRPPATRQFERLEPRLEQLQKAFDTKRISLRESAAGIEPELALVFETIGSVDNFYTAVRHYPEIEWMFDVPIDQIKADDDFYHVNAVGKRKEGDLKGKLFCVMTSRAVLDDLVSMWKHYKDDKEYVFKRGLTGLRDVFLNLHDIRPWGTEDRIENTGVMEYWRQCLGKDIEEVNFEIELFFRRSAERRLIISENILQDISSMGGKVIKECLIEDIHYHCILASLPQNQIEGLVENYEEIELVRAVDIMFFRPVGQVAIEVQEESSEFDEEARDIGMSDKPPIIGILDGYPMENHLLLSGKLIVDDPDNWEQGYLVRHRCHGTAMASIVLYGDYNAHDAPLNRRVYARPIYKTIEGINGYSEQVPDNELLVDLIHRSVKRLFEGDGANPAVAPTIKIINLSLGDPVRQFINMMSPLARLIDWLSYKYKVLFIISAGNHNGGGIDCGIQFADFKGLTEIEKEHQVINFISRNSHNMRLLSPSESINGLTIGALFADASDAHETGNTTMPYESHLPSPTSAVGYGYNKSIKPDIFVNGGRKLLRESVIPIDGTLMKWVGTEGAISHPPGVLVAVPGQEAERSYKAYTFGTSNSAAQVSHESGKCYDVLDEIFSNQVSSQVPDDYASVLLKAMLVHSSEWGANADRIVGNLGLSGSDANRLAKWLGNGSPDFTKVCECEERRITLIGYGSLLDKQAHSYYLPLPIDFASSRLFRKMAVTLGYLSPVVSTRQQYRSALLWFTLENNALFENRINTDVYVVKRGTLQHEVFFGERAQPWDTKGSVVIKVNCAEDAGKIIEPIPYSIFVTFEVAGNIDIDIYSAILTRVREMVTVQARAA